jgi:hypothetical protein
MFKMSRWLCNFWLYEIFFKEKCKKVKEEQQTRMAANAFENEHGYLSGQFYSNVGGSRRTRLTRRLTRRRNRKTRRK